jgi:hypothetical protein
MVAQAPRTTIKIHRSGESVPEEYRGFGTLNASGIPELMDPWDAIYALNMTNRIGYFGDQQGILATRPGYAPKPNFGFSTFTDYSPNEETYITRAMKKWYPSSILGAHGQMVRLYNDEIQKLDYGDTAWSTIANGTGLSTAGYPEMVVFGKPLKTLVIPHPIEGLLCLDNQGNFWHQAIPQGAGGGNISGCMIVAQLNTKLFVMGNYFDEGEGLNVYYCGANNCGVYTDPTSTAQWQYPNGGMFRIYAVNSRDRRSDPMRVTGAAEMAGRLVIFTETGRYIVTAPGTGSERIDYEVGAGCLAPGLVAAHLGRVYWCDTENVYEYYGGDPLKIGRPVNPLLKHAKFTDDSGNLIVQNFFSFVFHNRIWFNIRTSGLRGISGNYINTNFIFDTERRSWDLWNIPICAATIAESGFDLSRLYFASPESRSGQYKCHRFMADDQEHPDDAEVFDDDGRDMRAIWRTGRLGGGIDLETVNKKFWFLRFNMDIYKGTHITTARVNQFVDKDDDMPGTITLVNANPSHKPPITGMEVLGINTKFLRDLRVGQRIAPIGDTLLSGLVASVKDNTHATLANAYTDAPYTGDWCCFWPVEWPQTKLRTSLQKFGLNHSAGTNTTIELDIIGSGRLSIKQMELIVEPLPLDQEDIPE